jgi:hypothetical protein
MVRSATPIVVALALVSGCLIQQDKKTGRADFYWTFWSQSLAKIGAATDTGTSVCTRAAVEQVRITLATPAGELVAPSTGPCIAVNDVPGAAFTGLEPGRWGYYLEGLRGGTKVYEALGSFDAVNGQPVLVEVNATAPSGSWDVNVAFTTGTCAPGDRLDFDLFETTSGTKVFSTRDGAVNPPIDLPCASSGSFTIPSVAAGQYRFSDWVRVAADGVTPLQYSECRPTWTQPSTGNAVVVVRVTASSAPPAGNAGVCP